jgi:hypothetical protein
MTVQASMDVGIPNVSIHGWANIRHRTTSGLPTAVPFTIPTPNPMTSTLPFGAQTPKDNVRCVRPGKAMALAAPGKTSPCNP